MNVIADRLVQALAKSGTSDDIAARFFDVDQATFTRWKNGTVVPPSTRADRLAEFLDTDRTTVLVWLADSKKVKRPSVDRRLALLEEAVGLLMDDAVQQKRKLSPALRAFAEARASAQVPQRAR